ncbi:DUF6541 family protein [Georgenia sp. Z1344]|uniref:DUF6541 family protein n=1 Tax=Georgenia sp. Z1344 TaxID=3416706 RepID=UPI003CF92FCA
MTWAQFVLPTTLMLVTSIVPGALMLAAVGVRGLIAVGGGAVLTISAAGGLGIIYDLVGVPYTTFTQLFGLLVCVGLAAAIGHGLGTAPWVTGPRAREIVQPVPLGRTATAVLVAMVLVGTIVHCVSLARGMVAPGQPVQTWDGVFHLGAIRTIAETGNASVLGGLAPMYDELESPFYPAVWHGFVAVSPGFDLPSTAANASSFVMGPIWLISSAALARAVWPQRPLAAVAAPLVAASFVTTPGVLLGVVSLLPYGAAHVGMPGLLALVALALRQLPHAAPTVALAVPSLVGFIGVGLTHGSAAFTMMLLAGPLVAVGIYRASRHAWDAGHRQPVYVTLGVLAALLVAGIVALANFPVLDMVTGFERGGQETYWGPLGQVLIDNPMVYSYDWRQSVGQIVVTALTVVGLAVTFTLRSGRWVALGWVCAVVLTVITAGPEDGALRVIAGPWYTQPSRVVVLVGIMAVPLAALGASAAARSLADLWVTVTGRGRATEVEEPRMVDGPTRDGADADRRYTSRAEAERAYSERVEGERMSGERVRSGRAEAEHAYPSATPRQAAARRRPETSAATTTLNDRGRRSDTRPALVALVAVLGVIVVVTNGLRADLKSQVIVNSYVPDRIAWGTMLSQDEIELVTHAGDVLPDDAVVIGDPFSGAGYLWSMGGVNVLYRQLGQWDSEELTTLGTSFDEIYTNPEICEIVRDLGVTHVYTDTDPRGAQEDEQKYSYRTEGLAYVRPAEGFELVASAGTTSIWRLTYCDDPAAGTPAGG